MALNGRSYSIIGVTQPGLYDVFSAIGQSDLWVPVMMMPQTDRADVMNNRRVRRFLAVGQLRVGVSLEQAQSQMSAIADRLDEAYPNANAGMGVSVQPIREAIVGNLTGPALALLVGAGIVFLIGCLNAASLFLVRATTRARQTALQMALGATSGVIAQQVIVEALLLSVVGGVIGIVLVHWSLDALLALSPVTLPGFASVQVSVPVLAAAAGLTLLGGLAFGAGAASRSAKTDLRDQLSGSERTAGGGRDERTRHTLVVAEVATAVMLLVGAGGVRTERLLTARVNLPAASYPNHRAISTFGMVLAERLEAIPGVESADLWGPNLLMQPTFLRTVVRREAPVESSADAEVGRPHFVTPGALERIGLQTLKGRGITDTDRNPHSPVVVISEGLAQTLYGDGDPLGRFIRYYVPAGSPLDTVPWAQVVGVVSNAKNGGRVIGPGGFDSDHDQYFSIQERPRWDLVMMIRTTGDPMPIAGAVREAVHDVDPGLAMYGLQTMDDVMALEEQTARFTAMLMTAFGAVALFLAALGIYGALAYSVSQRTREIGLRSALGATGGDNVRMFVGHGMRLAALGVVLGLVGSLGLTRFVSSLLFGVRATDVVTFMAAPVLLLVVALAACYLPTRRALRVDPMEALRAD